MAQTVKKSACRRPGFDPGSGKSPEEGNGKPLQYSYLGKPTDRGAWLGLQRRCKELDTTEKLTHMPTLGTKISHAMEQLSKNTTTTESPAPESMHHN